MTKRNRHPRKNLKIAPVLGDTEIRIGVTESGGILLFMSMGTASISQSMDAGEAREVAGGLIGAADMVEEAEREAKPTR